MSARLTAGAGLRFAQTLALFALPIVAAFAAIEVRLGAVPNAYSRKLELIDRQRAALEVLVLGSSHEYAGVNTDRMSLSAFNLAMPSQSLAQSAELGLKYLPQPRAAGSATGSTLPLPRLRHVLLGIGYFALPYRMSGSAEPRLGFYMRAYHVFADTTFRDRINPARYLYSTIYGWGAVQTLVRRSAAIDFSGHLSATGYDPVGLPGLPADAGPSYFAASAVARAAFHHGLADPANIPRNLELLRRLAAQCHVAGVRLLLFTSPVTSDYAAAFGDATWQKYRAAIEQVAREVHVSYLDYSRDPAFGWRDFGDADHLNADGAAKFTNILSEQLRQY
jgi:hypothetical protein